MVGPKGSSHSTHDLIPTLLFLVALATVVKAMPDPQRSSGGYGPDPHSSGGFAHQPANYNYGYNVNDKHQGANFGHDEQRNGDQTSGKYYVHLPDGRMQTVTYTVDGYKGYVAEVKYTGKAHHDPHSSQGGFQGGYH
eukprot:maker-scaffold72_size415059-snap-gene-2.19 protein:Tk08672 transcript:maker-scaffold72_size415059-snap-gene-2.19-mRNA-1 annotation:"hypothetical protein DAPPUDRAFT_112094"